MPINLFQDSCKNISNKTSFGICDDIVNAPAYLDEDTTAKWIAIISNPSEKEIEFYAIDNCVEIVRSNGEMESRCDGLLVDQNSLIFVELKERASSGWFGKGSDQLKTVINIFKANYKTSDFTSIEAYVCNSLKPRSNPSRATTIQKFYDETGFILRDKQTINL